MGLTKLLLLLLLVEVSIQASSPTSPTYEAGVVEFFVGNVFTKPYPEWTSEQLAEYVRVMDEAPSNLDILVFPEATLNVIPTAVEIPDPEDKISPCDDASYEEGSLVKTLSCAIKRHQRYTIINLTTKVACPDAEMIANQDPRKCPDHGFSFYNTNVVFDRNGTVISRYRKFHLFGEKVDRPLKPTTETFLTDFGVKFGHFICFDIVYRHPALELVRHHDLTDIIYPTMWFSELPYSSAIQVHQGWAHANNVNVLAAGANNLIYGSTGTGIYGGRRGAYVSDMAGVNRTALYTATVHKIRGFPQHEGVKIDHNVTRYTKEQMMNLYTARDPLIGHKIEFLNTGVGTFHQERNVCQNGVCCNIKVNFTLPNSSTTTPHYEYAFDFFHGVRSFQGVADGGVIACTLLACPSRNASTCGYRAAELENIHVWNSITIEAVVPTKDGQYMYLPSTVDTTVTTLQPGQFEYVETDLGESDKKRIKMKLIAHADDLITFGVYGRDFNLDKNTAKVAKASVTLMGAPMFAYYALNKMMN